MMYRLLARLCLFTVSCAALDFSGFEILNDPPQDFSSIEFGLSCSSTDEFVGRVSTIHWTVEPTEKESVVISSKPANLVQAKAYDGVLSFNNNNVTLSMHQGGAAVRIQVPVKQLEGIRGASGTSFVAQVLEGFSALSWILQEGRESQLYISTNNTGKTLHLVDRGRSNTMIVRKKAQASVDISAKGSSIIIDGTLESGSVSGSNNVVWANNGIKQLTVSGLRNRIFGGDLLEDECEFVDLKASPNKCSPISAEFPSLPNTVTSQKAVMVSCHGGGVTDPETSRANDSEIDNSSAWRLGERIGLMATVVTGLLCNLT